ncbi:trimeric LpxA-like protein [Kockovaella imperatae]|uniref:Trimeric LpxA-like protein n=1 Tax=Kockovaella imperatae TaxID=4999 RepID=A0A1Y1UR56_9TREE|nr:trimeric LpxA-like protein [Kockovaella imperatae]ORX40558.1 trimeric LpxA-like protein [Kockovaella imperatae]
MMTPSDAPSSDASHPDRFAPDYPPICSLQPQLPELEEGESLDEYNRSIIGRPYQGFDPFLVRAREICYDKLDKFNSPTLKGTERQAFLSGLVSLTVRNPRGHTESVALTSSFKFGREIYVGPGCTFIDVAPICIGSRTQIGPNTEIYTSNHPISPEERNGCCGPETGEPVIIGTDVWIGAGSIILRGITIGDGAVVGAGSVVTRNVESRTVVAGNPARLLKRIEKDGRVTDVRGTGGVSSYLQGVQVA